MSKLKDEVVSWKPETEEDRQRIQQELSSILASSHFRNSKRYPALLRYVVEKSLDGQADQLKERLLGIEVFYRRPDYDTNADPVVRFSAGEIRKRIAQYYQEAEEAELRIELPLGSYAPEFRLRLPMESGDLAPAVVAPSVQTAPEPGPAAIDSRKAAVPVLIEHPVRRRVALYFWIPTGLFIIAALVFAMRGTKTSNVDKLWQPMLASYGPLQLIISTGNLELKLPEAPETTLYAHMVGPYHHVSLSSAIALSRLTNALELRKKTYVVKESQSTGLPDLRERSVILVGGLNNLWTLRLMAPLRYRLLPGPIAQIEDVKDQSNKSWVVDFNQPFTSVKRDYGVVARYHDTATNGQVLIVAGLGSYGTEAASEFVASAQYLEQIERKLGARWADKNMEAVIETDVIAGEAGPPQLIALTTW